MMAEKLAPLMAEFLMKHGDTQVLGKILSAWDFRDDPDQAAPAIFQTTYRLFALRVFGDDLGLEKATLMLNNWYFWQERLAQMVIDGQSSWFDDIQTPDKTETMEELFHQAALRMVADLSDKEKILAVLPGGVSGRTFHAHQQDQVDDFMSGKNRYWWFSDNAIQADAKSTLILTP